MGAASPFLTLPLELRAQIYGYVALDVGIQLQPQSGDRPISWSPLSLVCRQLHDEYNDALYASAPGVTAYVRDFDFTHVISFLDNLDKGVEIQPPSGLAPPPSRDLNVSLILTPSSPSPARQNLELLWRWVVRIARQNKQQSTSSFRTRYSVHKSSIDDEANAIAPVTLMRIIDEVYCTWFLRTLPGPLKEEIGKICDCLGAVEMDINRRRSSLPSTAGGPSDARG